MTDARPQTYALWFAAAGCCLACTSESPSVDRTAVDSTAESSAVGNPSPSHDGAATSTGRAGSTSVGAAGSTSAGAAGGAGGAVIVPGASAGGSGSPTDQPTVVGGGGRPGAGVGETGGGSGGGTPDGSDAPGGAPAQGGSATSSVPGGQGGVGQGGALGPGGSAGAGSELPPYVPPGYQLVYDESFSEPSSFDQLLIANEGEWFHSPEGYVEFTAATYVPPYRSPFSLALIEGVRASSFVLEVEMLQTGVGLGHRDMVVAWNVVSPSEFYYAHVSAEHDDVAHHIHIVNQADRAAITEAFTPGFDWGTDVWRTLRVVRDAVNGTMDVYDVDNDELILSATDSTFTTGFFGVGSFDNTGRVRNLRIWSPDATDTAIPFTF